MKTSAAEAWILAAALVLGVVALVRLERRGGGWRLLAALGGVFLIVALAVGPQLLGSFDRGLVSFSGWEAKVASGKA